MQCSEGDKRKEYEENRAGGRGSSSQGFWSRVWLSSHRPQEQGGTLHLSTISLPGATSEGAAVGLRYLLPGCSQPGEERSCSHEDTAILSHLPTARLPPPLLS